MPQKERPKCRHCGLKFSSRPRGLCWTCYYTPGVPDQYPSTSPYAYRGIANDNSSSPLPAEPTGAAPGSEEKIRILCERAARGELLFHPGDARLPRPARTRGAYRVVGSDDRSIDRRVRGWASAGGVARTCDLEAFGFIVSLGAQMGGAA